MFFKMAKHCLNMCNEVELRAFGGMFLELLEEIKDIRLVEALERIIGLAIDKMRTVSMDCKKTMRESLKFCRFGHGKIWIEDMSATNIILSCF